MKKIVILCIIILFNIFLSCNKKDNVSYYAKFNNEEEIVSYYKKKTYQFNDSIIDTTYKYDKNKRFIDYEINEKIIKNKKMILNKSIYPFLDTCSITKKDEYDIKICFIGKKNVLIDNKEYSTKEYLIQPNIIDGINYYEYYDNNLNLIRREFKDGFAPYFRIDKFEYIKGLEDSTQ